MKCKTFECPYLTEEDKKFLEYEQKIYEESAKEIIALYRRCEDKHKSDCDGQDDYLQYSLLRFLTCVQIYRAYLSEIFAAIFFKRGVLKSLKCLLLNVRC